MKIILFVVMISILLGLKSSRLRWKEVTILALVIGLLVAVQTCSIVFRHIDVE